jgi:two-component system response regulator PrrA
MNNTRNLVAHSKSAVTPRVLIVDDDPEILAALSGSLRKGGFDVELAATDQQAASALEDGQFDAVVLDPDLPNAAQAQLLERAFQGNPDLLLLVLTESLSLESAVAACRALRAC